MVVESLPIEAIKGFYAGNLLYWRYIYIYFKVPR